MTLKITKEIHCMWKSWNTFSEEIKNRLGGPVIGKWYYHYENKNGRIGLIKLNYNLNFHNNKWQNYCWEACGALHLKHFTTRKEAEIEIYKALKEKR